MRHRAKGRQLSRTATHRRALLRNMACSLFEHEGINTTVAKAKELRPYAEKLVTLARRGDLHAIRQVEQKIPNRTVLTKLFKTVSSEFHKANSVARRQLYHDKPENAQKLIDQHTDIYEAIRSRSPEAASQAMLTHLLFAEGELRRWVV